MKLLDYVKAATQSISNDVRNVIPASYKRRMLTAAFLGFCGLVHAIPDVGNPQAILAVFSIVVWTIIFLQSLCFAVMLSLNTDNNLEKTAWLTNEIIQNLMILPAYLWLGALGGILLLRVTCFNVGFDCLVLLSWFWMVWTNLLYFYLYAIFCVSVQEIKDFLTTD